MRHPAGQTAAATATANVDARGATEAGRCLVVPGALLVASCETGGVADAPVVVTSVPKPRFLRRRVRAAACDGQDSRSRFHTSRGLVANFG